jgi:hypothetical protein
MVDVAVPIIVTLLTVGGASGLTWLVQAIRGQGRVDAAASLAETARKMVNDFEEDAKLARVELRQTRDESRTEVAALRADLRRCATEAHAIADELRNLRLAIMHPAATIDGLRELVKAGGPPAGNGSVNLRREP